MLHRLVLQDYAGLPVDYYFVTSYDSRIIYAVALLSTASDLVIAVVPVGSPSFALRSLRVDMHEMTMTAGKLVSRTTAVIPAVDASKCILEAAPESRYSGLR